MTIASVSTSPTAATEEAMETAAQRRAEASQDEQKVQASDAAQAAADAPPTSIDGLGSLVNIYG